MVHFLFIHSDKWEICVLSVDAASFGAQGISTTLILTWWKIRQFPGSTWEERRWIHCWWMWRNGSPLSTFRLVNLFWRFMVKSTEHLYLTRSTIGVRFSELAVDLESQLKLNKSRFVYFSIAIDENFGITDAAELVIFIHWVNESRKSSSWHLWWTPQEPRTFVALWLEHWIESEWTSLSGYRRSSVVGRKAGLATKSREKVSHEWRR